MLPSTFAELPSKRERDVSVVSSCCGNRRLLVVCVPYRALIAIPHKQRGYDLKKKNLQFLVQTSFDDDDES